MSIEDKIKGVIRDVVDFPKPGIVFKDITPIMLYGTASIEMHVDAVNAGDRILIHDDLLATGGSAEAAAILVQKCGAQIAGFNFLVGLDFLNGSDRLKCYSENIINLVRY